MRKSIIFNAGREDQMMAGINEKHNRPAMTSTNEACSFSYVVGGGKKENVAVNLAKQENYGYDEGKELSLLLKSGDWSKLKKYLRKHSLSYTDEYQLVTWLVMEVEDTDEAENIISCYIKYHGLHSFGTLDLLKNLGFNKALKVFKAFQREQKTEEKENQYSDFERLCDGFMMLKDDDERFFIASYFDEPLASC